MNQARAGAAVAGLNLESEPGRVLTHPARVGGLSLGSASLDRAAADLDAGRLRLLGLRDTDLEHALVEAGLHIGRLRALGQRQRAREASEGPLDAMVALALFLALPRKIGPKQQLVAGLHQVHGGDPAANRAAVGRPAVEEPVKETVHLGLERVQ